jgi:Fe-Mn family superoxide dismutase
MQEVGFIKQHWGIIIPNNHINRKETIMNRRNFLATGVTFGTSALVFSRSAFGGTKVPAYSLPDLPYAYDALEPYIDARTMRIHHSKHHAGYVTKLNNAVQGSEWGKKSPEFLVAHLSLLPEEMRLPVRQNGGGHVNHTLFWRIMSPEGGGEPNGPLKKALEKRFGNYGRFREQFARAAMGRFGSGWAWLCVDGNTGTLEILSTPNQDNPLAHGHVPILGLDVWEHAYYLQYQNRRAEYVDAFFHLIDWKSVAALHADAAEMRCPAQSAAKA